MQGRLSQMTVIYVTHTVFQLEMIKMNNKNQNFCNQCKWFKSGLCAQSHSLDNVIMNVMLM